MKATAIHVTATTATVELRPNWLARLFGARTTRVDLERHDTSWITTNTGDVLWRTVWRDRIVIDALDFRPVVDPPRATAVCGGRR